jgi:hypothetical protein
MTEVLSVRQMRAQLDEILERARADEEFGARLNADTENVLSEAGLHSRAIGEVSAEIAVFAEGRGSQDEYLEMMLPQRPCDFTTCWISWCNHWGTFVTSP